MLKLSLIVDDKLKELKKREAAILNKSVGPTTKALLEETRKHKKQMENIVQ